MKWATPQPRDNRRLLKRILKHRLKCVAPKATYDTAHFRRARVPMERASVATPATKQSHIYYAPKWSLTHTRDAILYSFVCRTIYYEFFPPPPRLTLSAQNPLVLSKRWCKMGHDGSHKLLSGLHWFVVQKRYSLAQLIEFHSVMINMWMRSVLCEALSRCVTFGFRQQQYTLTKHTFRKI